MPLVVGVRFRDRGKIYYFDPQDIQVNVGDRVLVETVRGIEMGHIAMGAKDVPESKLVLPLKRVLRVATPEDAVAEEAGKKKAQEAIAVARQR